MKDDIAFAAVIFTSLATLVAVLALNTWDSTGTSVAAASGMQAAMARSVSCAQQVPGQLVSSGTPGTADRPARAHSSDVHR
jgi:hypothetical protein